ncbi:putative arabinan endo-1,5-alpha-L-arabinosidase A [Podospora aff. communis PSN243]|uniref:Arabinan endo-1,5-alpha-L-arabinosidase n=1 Tax=Podospora aff. communis PSN243 TaxID=3040156 RepID=A0AAV9GKP2_9PEZI|nr:putative arabinan endo-1,5-alpha-L-arabinosidase A [Podospora aff. communis PSN243]
MKAFLPYLLFAVPQSIHSYALPGACSGICTNTHDPSVIIRNGTYFRFSTGGRIAIHTAPSIAGPWTYKGPLLPKGSMINLRGNQDLWAPDVAEVNGSYYCYYSVSTFGSQTSAIGLATSPDLETWTDLGSTGIESDPSKPYNAIDANLIDINGTKLLTFGSFWNGLYQTQMQSHPTSILPSSRPYQVSYNRADTAMEGPTVFRNGAYYYLFYSKGSCCGYDRNRPAAGKEYKIMVCRSTSPTGGFVDKARNACTNGGGTVVLESHNDVYGPGGQCVFEDPVQGPILAYHYVDRRVGYADGQKRFGWNKMDFSSGWPVV